jgi:hypothetical protein
VDDVKITYYSSSGGFTDVTENTQEIYTNSANPYQCGAINAGDECKPYWSVVPAVRGKFTLRMDVTSDCNVSGYSNEKIFYAFEKTLIQDFTSDKNVVARGDSYTLTGKLVDAEGNPVVGETVYIFDGNEIIGSTTTSADGSFTYTYTVPADATLGDHTIKAYFPTDGEAFYWESSATTTVRYSSKPRIENLSVSPQTVGIADTVTISADVYDDVGISSVTATITDPKGNSTTKDMSCSGSTCTADTNDTWIAGDYTVTVTATNKDGIQTSETASFTVEAYANFGMELENRAR